ncbi:hypothetical protein DSECCO2_557240 [anaerobic digester metagenome]
MLLGGLWHGASWNFVFWGGLHGIALVFDKFWLRLKFTEHKVMRALGILVTFNFVCFTWIFFRSPSFANSWLMIERIFTAFNGGLFWSWISKYSVPAALIALGYLAHWQPDSWERHFGSILRKMPVFVQSTLLALVIWILFQARSADIQPFIYFQF